jgi:hypothetical protein
MAGKHLRAVSDEPAPEDWIADQLNALCLQILAARPTAVVVLWEAGDVYDWGSVPKSHALARGMLVEVLRVMDAPDE